MRLKGLNEIFKGSEEYKEILSALREKALPCQVHGLSDSQKAYVSYCLFEDTSGQMLILTHNDIESKKLYDDISAFTDKCMYFPVKEMVFNIDVTSGDIKAERLKTIMKVLSGENVIVITSVDALLYRLPPKELLKKAPITLKTGDVSDILEIASSLIDMGYERVDMIEGKGQFAQRGGILDVFSPDCDYPVRIEFFGDEVDTIRSFELDSQRSRDYLEEQVLYPAREVIIHKKDVDRIAENITRDFEPRYKSYYKKNKESAERLKQRVNENIEKLRNLRHFEGIDSYIPYIYKESAGFLSYFKKPIVILDESARISQRIKTAQEEYQEVYKSLLEKGDVLPLQGEYMTDGSQVMDAIGSSSLISMNMLPRLVEDFRPLSLVNFNAIAMNSLSGNSELLLEEIKHRLKRKYTMLIMAGTQARAHRLADALKEEIPEVIYKDIVDTMSPGSVTVTFGSISRGMEFPDIKLSVISDKEVYRERKDKPKASIKKGAKISSFTDIKPGDYVVHVNHGIGMFKGVKELVIDGIKKDYLMLQYQGGDNLYVPVEQLDMVQKYIGGGENPPKLYKLGGTEWVKAKKKVKDSLKEMAQDLVALYAERSTLKGHAFSNDTAWQKQFEEEFPYEETADQLSSIQEIKNDMESPKPMDRLLCGDVGYGKTEVAMRAAFKAVMDGKQVAILVPTTILAEQHYNNFKQRFSEFAIRVDMISRFRKPQDQKKTILDVVAGNVDIIIGTHKLLQKDIKYKDLGLLIIDEEQRFGVTHKEKIKELKKNIDVLTLTATPIPRTLHMSLTGVRDMSLIETPPEERYPVQTYVMEYNEGMIRDSITREMSRGGQVFFVYNRVETILEMQTALSRLVPEAKIVVAHGQMDERRLEATILDFISGDGDVLLCTTIIETGIDMPNVNTLIVYDADRMGLSQLYQLRGRVGRSSRLAYAYFTYRKDKILSETAEKRLKAIKDFTEFGSGFKIAMRDLEIRGAGNLLGTQQHGHMATVGYDMYCRLLDEAVKEIKGDAKEQQYSETSIDLQVNAYIPDSYIENETMKIELYKRIASISSMDEKMDIEEEATDRFGDMPKPLENLINISYIKALGNRMGVTAIKQSGKDVILTLANARYFDFEVIKNMNSQLGYNIMSYTNPAQPQIRIRPSARFGAGDVIGQLKFIFEKIDSLHNGME